MSKEINIKDLLEKREPFSEKDEYFHDLAKILGDFPPYHNESWYFNFIDLPNKIFFITRLSVHMDTKTSRILVLLIVNGRATRYFNEIPLEEMPEKWEFDRRVKYYCIKPLNQWKIKYEDRRFTLNVNIEGRFPVINFGDVEDPKELLEKYGEEFVKIAAQEHYEQPTIATGTLDFKKKHEIYKTVNIKGLGHRDHSWGVRKWVQIDGWNWVSAQFEDMTINFYKSHLLGKTPEMGVIHTKEGQTIIKKIEVSTKTKEDGKTPVSSTFILTDKNGKKITIESKTIHSEYLPVPSKSGRTEIFEQVVIFNCEGKEGNGISEYLISTRD